jgi:hypothetical protein
MIGASDQGDCGAVEDDSSNTRPPLLSPDIPIDPTGASTVLEASVYVPMLDVHTPHETTRTQYAGNALGPRAPRNHSTRNLAVLGINVGFMDTAAFLDLRGVPAGPTASTWRQEMLPSQRAFGPRLGN